MSQYILINRIKVQNANAIAGFTWGFPAITHFLGFIHNVSRKLSVHKSYHDIHLDGVAVIAHKHHVHTYRTGGDYQFTQSRNPAYRYGEENKYKIGTPPVIEEGKMNMTVSLLIAYDGNLGNRTDEFFKWLENTLLLQRLAGGTILTIKSLTPEYIESDTDLRKLKRKLLPGFILKDRAEYLTAHYEQLKQQDEKVELLDAWLDFSALKQKARPKSDKITKYFNQLSKSADSDLENLLAAWQKHLDESYDQQAIPERLKIHFKSLNTDELSNENTQSVLKQWADYCKPIEKIDTDWEYIKKPEAGYLVPIMTGYKAISKVYKNSEIENTRDHETPVCFVESVHSVGEWLSTHRLSLEQSGRYEKFEDCFWRYSPYKENWYLCTQQPIKQEISNAVTLKSETNEFC
ncbi:type I-F CRISPR-associated protein Csy2 [Colwellia sp. 39_35_sub15_T18]|nr:type I-F CRISPR-associated protein Csy2 [Colwellia sp. 39_35_sub15_T18]